MKQLTSPYRAVALALLVTVAAFAIALPVSAQDSAATEIDSCITITEPGEYVLTDDIEDSEIENCIEIEASDVTLDGNGHTIDGVEFSESDQRRGIYVNASMDLTNVTITGVTVTNWFVGIFNNAQNGETTENTVRNTLAGIIARADDTVVAGNTVTDNDGGISVDGDDSTVANNDLTSNGVGLTITESDLQITGNTISDSKDGIVGEFVTNSTIANNTVTGSSDRGLYLDSDSHDNRIVDDTFSGNAVGIFISESFDTTIRDTSVSDSDEWDVYTEQNAFNTTADDLTLDSATVSFDATDVALGATESPPDDPKDHQNIDQYVSVTGTSDEFEGGEPFFSVAVSYSNEDIAEAGVDEDSLRLYKHVDGEWTEVPGSSVDTDANTVSGTVSVDDESMVVASLGSPAGDNNKNDAGDGDGNNADDDDNSDGTDGDQQDEGDGNTGNDDAENSGSESCQDVTAAFDGITISDLDLAGPGLSDTYIDHRTYEVGGFDIDTDGVSVTIGGKDYTVGCISIVVEPFTVTLEDITLSDA